MRRRKRKTPGGRPSGRRFSSAPAERLLFSAASCRLLSLSGTLLRENAGPRSVASAPVRPFGRGDPAAMAAGTFRPHWAGEFAGVRQWTPPPYFLFNLVEKKTGRDRSKRKGRFFAALRCSGPPRGRGSPELVPTGLAGHLPARAAPCGFQSLVPRFWCGGRRGGRRIVSAPLLPARGMPHLTAPRRTRQRLAERKARRSENIKCDFSPHPLPASRRGDRRTSLNKPRRAREKGIANSKALSHVRPPYDTRALGRRAQSRV